MHDYQESVTIGRTDRQTDAQTDAGLIESTTTLYRGREIHPSVKDLQSTTRLAESWKLHIFDTRVDFPVPVQSGGWLFFSNPPECQRFAVHDEACRVVEVAYLWHEGGFSCPCTKWWLIIFLQSLWIAVTIVRNNYIMFSDKKNRANSTSRNC